jgi:hypothetical protein
VRRATERPTERRRRDQGKGVPRSGGRSAERPGNALSEKAAQGTSGCQTRAREAPGEKPQEGKETASLRACIAERALSRGSAERRIRGHAETRPGQAERTGGEPLSSVEAQAPSELVLVHDRVGVAVRDAGVVRQPMGAFVAA